MAGKSRKWFPPVDIPPGEGGVAPVMYFQFQMAGWYEMPLRI
jgi:hypothetical protein